MIKIEQISNIKIQRETHLTLTNNKLYKYCPGVQRYLWNLLRVAWKNQVIPSEWRRAVTVFIPKETNSTTISQFRSIALLNVEGKIFFSILAKRLTTYLISNGYIDTSCQKAGVPGFPGCVEHSAVIWEQIQRAKRERGDLHGVAGSCQCIRVRPPPTHRVCLGLLLHPSLHPCPGSQVL